jgi:hypothetical protein
MRNTKRAHLRGFYKKVGKRVEKMKTQQRAIPYAR